MSKYKNREEISNEIESRHLILMPDGKEVELDMNNPKEVKKKLKEKVDM